MRYQVTKQRSLTKSITFRIVVVISDLVVIYVITKKVGATIALTVFTNLASTMLYFFHERVWNRIMWGRQRVR